VAVRRDAGLWGYERALARAGFLPVAGADEAGRGACAGPLVIAAVILPEGRRGQVPELADSKLLSPETRTRVHDEVLARALAVSVVIVSAADVDRLGLHYCNVTGMRRALARLAPVPAFVLTDGFAISGLGVPGLAVWKGDRVVASIAAASVVAKVTRDRIMVDLSERYPTYDFATHKGYVTDRHEHALATSGPCPEHRLCYINVARRAGGDAPVPRRTVVRLGTASPAAGENDEGPPPAGELVAVGGPVGEIVGAPLGATP
jgi:ribonuclease HII